jgi:type II secretory ATPase GspE/PulE/Tfp pilus assembly ATPase PilB-like protein
MQASLPLSIWQQLKQQQISCEYALEQLVDHQGMVQLHLLDREVHQRFWRNFSDRDILPPVIPLLLWRNCYYLGSPVTLSPVVLQQLGERLNSSIQIISITEKSYRYWCRIQELEAGHISAARLVNPLTGEQEQEDITEIAELHLAQVDNQIERLKALIASALRNRASDIHLAPASDGLRVRFRIDGILRHVTTLAPDVSRKLIVALKVMCNMDIAESRRPQDGRIGEQYMIEQEQQGLDLRVSVLPCISNRKGEPAEKAVLRLLRQQNTFSTIADLGFSERTRQLYEGWLREPQGVIIFTGPTGSGKTSTLYTSLQAIATESVNIVTVEDPVEYVLPDITQTQVHEIAGMTFAAGLRAILRQDPDIIMVGEIRDSETAETAIRAALTGHLVLTTLHTNDAIGVIPRLKDIGPDPGLISDALLGIVAQRLVRKVCPHCAEPCRPTPEDLKLLGLTLETANPSAWRVGKGCANCFQSGYLGREAVIELLNVDDVVRQLIYEGTITQLRHYLHKIQFDSFRVAAIGKVTSGITTVAEVRRVLPHSVFFNSAGYSFTQLGEDIGLKGGVGALPPARGSTPAPRPNPNP